MAQILLDSVDFTVAQGYTAGDTLPTDNAKWHLDDGTNFNAISVRAASGIGQSAGASCQISNSGAIWTNDQWAQLTVDSVNLAGVRFHVLLRVQAGVSPLQGYWGGAEPGVINGTYKIGKWGAGASTVLATGTHAYALGDAVNFQVQGSQLVLVINSVTEVSVTDATYTSGRPGALFGDTTTNRLAGTWRAGSVGAGRIIPVLINLQALNRGNL